MLPTFLKVMDDIVSGALLIQRVTTLLQPAAIASPMVATLAALASMLTLLLLSGVAIGSVMVLLTTVLALYFVLTEVLGITVEMTVP